MPKVEEAVVVAKVNGHGKVEENGGVREKGTNGLSEDVKSVEVAGN